MRCLPIAIAAALTLPVTAAQAQFKDFRDWLAACDNLRDCAAFATGADGDELGAYLKIERGGAADAPAVVTLSVDLGHARHYTVAFDDPALPGLPSGALTGKEGEGNDYRSVTIASDANAERLIASIRKAKALVVTRHGADGTTGKLPISRLSMAGATASLLWIDERQKRLDTVTALVKRGDKPASAVPPQPAAPVVIAAPPSDAKASQNPSKALLTKGRALCGDNDPTSQLQDVSPLGGGLFLFQFDCPQSSGAYNFLNVFLIGPAADVKASRPATFQRPRDLLGGGKADDETDGPAAGQTNPFFDSKTMTLTSFFKGRGLGDCGVQEKWIWDGKAFRLALQKTMGECRLIPMYAWPVTWRADVKR